MGRIKSVKKAETVQCKDAVTKEALKAVLSKSHDASYKRINIHNVKDASVFKAYADSTMCTVKNCNSISARKAAIGYIHADVPGYKKADYNLTIEELFSGTGRNFR